MRDLLQTAQTACAQQRSFYWITVLEARGSVPGKAGAQMLVDSSGRLAGTVGGGALEFRVTQTAQQALLETKELPCIQTFSLDANDAAGLGMICGGSLDLLFTRLSPVEEAVFQEALQAMDAHQESALFFPLDGKVPVFLTANLPSESGQMVSADGISGYVCRLLPAGRVWIFGAGHLAIETVPLLAHLGFRVRVLDDRAEFADPSRFLQAESVELVSFEELSCEILPEDDVLIMTRGHLGDLAVERYVLGTPARYIGVVGSRRKARMVREMLEEEGFSKGSLDRVVTPVGIDIGAETPAEIAVSIAAQLVRVRSKLPPRF